MGKTAPALLAIALLAGTQAGCRSCGGSHLDYGSPVAGCACSSCEGGCRAGSAFGGEVVSTTVDHAPQGGEFYSEEYHGGMEGEVIIGEAESPIPAPPEP